MMLRLQKKVVMDENSLTIGSLEESKKIISLKEFSETELQYIIEMLGMLEGSLIKEEALLSVLKKMILNNSQTEEEANITYVKMLKFLEILKHYRLIEIEEVIENNDLHKTELYLQEVYNANEEQIKSIAGKKVAIVGCGSIGKNTAVALIHMGIKNFVIIDDLFFHNSLIFNDVYTNNELETLTKKANSTISSEMLKEELLSINPKINVNIEYSRITKERASHIMTLLAYEEYNNVDIVCWCKKVEPTTKKNAIESAINFKVPIIFGEVKEHMGYVGPFFDKEDIEIYLADTKNLQNPICKILNKYEQEKVEEALHMDKISFIYEDTKCPQPNWSPLNMQVSSYIADAAYLYLLNGENKLKGETYTINSKKNIFNKIRL